MVSSTKILTVSYGTFSCTAEGFEDPLAAVKDATHFFRSVVTEDRFFGAEPPQFDPELASEMMRRQIDGIEAGGALTVRSPAFGTGAASSGALAAALAAGPSLASGRMQAAAPVSRADAQDGDDVDLTDSLPDDDTIDAVAEIVEVPNDDPALDGPAGDTLGHGAADTQGESLTDAPPAEEPALDDSPLAAAMGDAAPTREARDDGAADALAAMLAEPSTDVDSMKADADAAPGEAVALAEEDAATGASDDGPASSPEPVLETQAPAPNSIAAKLERIRNVVARKAQNEGATDAHSAGLHRADPLFDTDDLTDSVDTAPLASVFDDLPQAASQDMPAASDDDSAEPVSETQETQDAAAQYAEEYELNPELDITGALDALYDPAEPVSLSDPEDRFILSEPGTRPAASRHAHTEASAQPADAPARDPQSDADPVSEHAQDGAIDLAEFEETDTDDLRTDEIGLQDDDAVAAPTESADLDEYMDNDSAVAEATRDDGPTEQDPLETLLADTLAAAAEPAAVPAGQSDEIDLSDTLAAVVEDAETSTVETAQDAPGDAWTEQSAPDQPEDPIAGLSELLSSSDGDAPVANVFADDTADAPETDDLEATLRLDDGLAAPVEAPEPEATPAPTAVASDPTDAAVYDDAESVEDDLQQANDAAWEGLMESASPESAAPETAAQAAPPLPSEPLVLGEPTALPETEDEVDLQEDVTATVRDADDDWSAIFAEDTQQDDGANSEADRVSETDPALAENRATPLRARVVKVKRAVFDQALAQGDVEEIEDDPLSAASADTGLDTEEERALREELEQIKAEFDEDTYADSAEPPQAFVADSPITEDDWPEDTAAALERDTIEEDAAPLRLEDPVAPQPEPDIDIEGARKAVRLASPARAMLTESSVEENDASRLMAQTDSALEEPEGNRRRSAIAHLRAAVAATRADKQLMRKDEQGATEAYRRDLETVVRPRRPQTAAIRSERPEQPGTPRPAPLTLVAEQRVAQPAADTTAAPVRPRRVSLAEETGAALSTDAHGGFVAYAEDVGARDLPELLEAAAAYMSYVEERPQFSRPQLMTIVRQAEGGESSREDRLRSFGKLLREGKIEKTSGGRFTASDQIGFRPDSRAAG
ncbi:hypothetical protein [Cognatishimia sp. F0-27]|uniref:hypothetical protein n=1 Tax=Cognatishimia sp. F0-27 TaxID=2816855 RepID=UPI001D0CA4FE|nr:hypothetical protein [Cognatishimia sp. F0-27]MCC1493588.1 hypothetical protein [Cognatishimia sp. F0-27]